MFFLQNAFGQSLFIVLRHHGKHSLTDDGTRIYAVIYKMHRSARKTDTILQGLAGSVQSLKGWQKRGMDIDDTAGKGSCKFGSKYTHISQSKNQIGSKIFYTI